MRRLTFLFSLTLSLPLWATAPQPTAGTSLRETFDLYVRSVQSSDLEGLFRTVTDKENFLFLTADGRRIDSRQGYYDFHESWFQERGWEMPVEVLEIREGRDYGYVTAVFHYMSKAPKDEPYETYSLDSYFTLIFHKENGQWKAVADICTPITRHYFSDNGKTRYTSEQRYLLNILHQRRTVRKFKSDPVPEDHLSQILDAARFAPTAGNQQPWKFLVVRDRAKLDLLKDEALHWYLESTSPVSDRDALSQVLRDVLSAPVYVAVLVDSKARYPDYVIHDGTLAVENLMIAARALGYGTGFYTTFFPEEPMKVFFGIPDRYQLICFTPIGVPEKWPETPSKKALGELVIFEAFK